MKRAIFAWVISTLAIATYFTMLTFQLPSLRGGHLLLAGLTAIYVAPFVLAGFLLLLPVIWLITRLALPTVYGLGAFIIAGGGIGTLLFLPLSDPYGLLLGTMAGSFSSIVWAVLNPNMVRISARSQLTSS